MAINKKRIKNVLKTYGLKNTIRRIIVHPYFVLRRTKYTYIFDKERRYMKNFEKKIKPIDKSITKVGNYYVNLTEINKKSIIYSFGVGVNIEFDSELIKKKQCSIHLFDPTPKSIRFIEEEHKNNNKLRFHPIGVWKKDQKIDFYFDSDHKNEADSASILNLGKNKKKFSADCKKISTIMDSLKHKRLDLLKMDIEGAAIPVLFNMIEEKIFPKQIVGEFERPKNNIIEVKKFIDKLEKLILLLKEHGYCVYKLPREKFPYFSVELLFIKEK